MPRSNDDAVRLSDWFGFLLAPVSPARTSSPRTARARLPTRNRRGLVPLRGSASGIPFGRAASACLLTTGRDLTKTLIFFSLRCCSFEFRLLACSLRTIVAALAQRAGADAVTVVIHFVQPAAPGGRAIDQLGFARVSEADWRISSPTERGSAPRYVSH